MTVDMTATWTSVCGELEVSLSKATFNYWVKPCSIRSVTEIDAERVIVELAGPSAFHIRQIDERYYGQIKLALEKQLGKRVELALVVGPGQDANGINTTAKSKEPAFEDGLYAERREVVSDAKGLYPRYTFEAFVVGGSNNLAYAAAKAVVEFPGRGTTRCLFGAG